MRGISRTLTAVAIGAAMAGGLGMRLFAQSAPARLGLEEREAQQDVLSSIENGWPSFGNAGRAFTALPVAARVAVVHAGFAWIKTYVGSPAFKDAAAKARENRKPSPPSFNGSVDDELKKKQADQAKSLADAKTMMASLPASAQAEVAATLAQAQAQMNDPKMIALMRANIENDRATQEQAYEADLKKWQEDVPLDPMVLVAERLRTFMDVSADVDFSATLAGAGRDARFANPAYEEKSSDWKMCFRAGKEAVDAARAEAADWLKTLPHS